MRLTNAQINMKKLLYILLALALFQSTAYLPYKFFLPLMVGSIIIIVTQINLYFYDRKKRLQSFRLSEELIRKISIHQDKINQSRSAYEGIYTKDQLITDAIKHFLKSK